METINTEELSRARVRIAEQIAYETGYKKGAKDVISEVSNWLDEDTIAALYEQFEIEVDDEED